MEGINYRYELKTRLKDKLLNFIRNGGQLNWKSFVI